MMGGAEEKGTAASSRFCGGGRKGGGMVVSNERREGAMSGREPFDTAKTRGDDRALHYSANKTSDSVFEDDSNTAEER